MTTTAGKPAFPKPHKNYVVATWLREQISHMSPGDRLPTVTELERHFGVATSTVVSALNSLERDGLIVRRHGSGTFVAHPSPVTTPAPHRSLTGFIALLASGGLPSGWMMNVLQSAGEELRAQGRIPLLIFRDRIADRFRLAQEHYAHEEIDGYLHLGSLLNGGVPDGLPGVVIGEVPEGVNVPRVAVDSVDAGRQVGEHLWNLGHRRIAFLYPEMLKVIAAPRLHGLQAAWADRGVVELPRALALPYLGDPGSGGVALLRPALEPLLTGPDPITAFFAVNDPLAVMAINTIRACGLRVPEDVSVVGFDDNQPLSTHISPALTTIRLPVSALAAAAAHMLRDVIDSGRDISASPAPRPLFLPGELILRESTGPASSR